MPVIKNLLVLKAKQMMYSRSENKDKGAKGLGMLENYAQTQVD